jgi:hypothetical protein
VSTYAGLCAGCRHARVIENRRGSRFTLCELSRHDERFPRYPALPVLGCAGYAPPDARAAQGTVPDAAPDVAPDAGAAADADGV